MWRWRIYIPPFFPNEFIELSKDLGESLFLFPLKFAIGAKVKDWNLARFLLNLLVVSKNYIYQTWAIGEEFDLYRRTCSDLRVIAKQIANYRRSTAPGSAYEDRNNLVNSQRISH